jgi:CheY-like chemotaxis protein
LVYFTQMSKLHIILADDDPDDCLILSEVFKETIPDGEITCFQDCESLLEYLESSNKEPEECIHPSLIFLDLNMPKMSGQDCLKKITRNEICRNIPIIIYSTAARGDIIDECYKLGASLYIVKPSDTDKLRQTILQVIKTFIKKQNSISHG